MAADLRELATRIASSAAISARPDQYSELLEIAHEVRFACPAAAAVRERVAPVLGDWVYRLCECDPPDVVCVACEGLDDLIDAVLATLIEDGVVAK